MPLAHLERLRTEWRAAQPDQRPAIEDEAAAIRVLAAAFDDLEVLATGK